MQLAHPEREGELARAHALILHGMVVPSPDDPDTGQVLSSDATTTYTVNGVCSCRAGAHGQGCKHMQAWKLYQHIARKVEAQTAPEEDIAVYRNNSPLPEAASSVNCHITVAGRQVQLTLRGHDEQAVLTRLEAVLARYAAPEPAAAHPEPAQPAAAQCRGDAQEGYGRVPDSSGTDAGAHGQIWPVLQSHDGQRSGA